jgi:hypothetical protein
MKEEIVDPTPSNSSLDGRNNLSPQLLAIESPVCLLESSTHTDSSKSALLYRVPIKVPCTFFSTKQTRDEPSRTVIDQLFFDLFFFCFTKKKMNQNREKQ